MAWTTGDHARNPFAPGGSHYDAYRAGFTPDKPVNYAPGPFITGTEWWKENPYAPGGAMYGVNPGVENNWTTQQLANSYQAQKSPSKPTDDTNPFADLLKGILGGMGGGGSSGGGGGGTGSGMGTVQSGIDVGPVWSADKVQAGAQQLRNMGNTPAPQFGDVGGAAGAALQRQYGDTLRGAGANAANEFTRSAAYANAQQQLASEKARAQSNITSAEMLARLQAQQYQNQLSGNAFNTSLLSGILGLL